MKLLSLPRVVLRKALLTRSFQNPQLLYQASAAFSTQLPHARPANRLPFDIEKDGGVRLARLAKVAQTLESALETDNVRNNQPSDTVSSLRAEVNEAHKIIRSALDKSGRPCTVDQLAERIQENVVPIATSALDYKDYLRATDLRDSIEEALVDLQIFPPREAFLDGEGKRFCRLERRRERQLQQQGLAIADSDDLFSNSLTANHEDSALTELRPVTQDELERRKAYLESCSTIEHILRGFDTVLLEVSRVHKVVKEGTTMRMRALVAIGNRKGVAGYGEGKAETPQHAIERACRDAKRNLLHIDLYKNRTIHHRVTGKFVGNRVSMWPKPEGSGITGNNNYMAILQLFGIKDVGAKQHGSKTLTNSVKALFNALSNLQTPAAICQSRGIPELERAPPLRSRSVRYRPL